MATRYLVSGGNGNWNSTTNWSTTSGGASGASFPVSTDNVIIDAASGNANIAINVASACLSLTIANAYTGTMNFQNTLTVSGSITLGSGMSFSNTSGTALLYVISTGTLTSNGKTFPYNIQFGGALQTYTLADNWVVSGNFTQGVGNAGAINGNSLSIGGNLNVGANAIYGTTTFILNGTGTWSGVGLLKNSLTINTIGTITIIGSVLYNTGTLTYTAGTVVTTGSTLSCSLSTNLTTNGIIWNNVTLSGVSQTFTLTNNMTIMGLFSFSGTNASGRNTINSNSAGVQRKITLLSGCLMDCGPFVNFTDITAEDGMTIWAYKPTLSNTTNIRALPYQLSTIGTVN